MSLSIQVTFTRCTPICGPRSRNHQNAPLRQESYFTRLFHRTWLKLSKSKDIESAFRPSICRCPGSPSTISFLRLPPLRYSHVADLCSISVHSNDGSKRAQ